MEVFLYCLTSLSYSFNQNADRTAYELFNNLRGFIKIVVQPAAAAAEAAKVEASAGAAVRVAAV